LNKTLFSIITVGIFLLSSLFVIQVSSETTTTTWFVDDDGGPNIDFTCIQDAINASSDGDTVFVYNGTYYENIIVDKSITLQGEDKERSIINAVTTNDYIIKINSDDVYISGFKIQNSFNSIFLSYSNNVSIINNYIEGYFCIYHSNFSNIQGNEIIGQLSFTRSNKNIVTNNTINPKKSSGIVIKNNCFYNKISYNIIRGCYYGIEIESSDNEITYNDFISNNMLDAFIRYKGKCNWNRNYWNRPKILPKILFGFDFYKGKFFIDFDMHPAKTRNCDFGGE